MRGRSFLLVLLACSGVLLDSASALTKAEMSEVGFDPKAGAVVPADVAFVDETGATKTLGSFLGRAPVLLVPGYYECPMLCDQTSHRLVDVLNRVDAKVGDSFDVVFYSIDPDETVTLAHGKKQRCLQAYAKPASEGGWHFLTGDEDAIRTLSEAIGFRYRYDKESDEFAHTVGVVVLTPEGKISTCLFGLDFSADEVGAAIGAASNQEVGSIGEQLLLLCYHYLPLNGKYGAVILNTLRALAGLTVLGLVGMMLRLGRKKGRGESSA